MKAYGKTIADSTVCPYGCCGRKLHDKSSGFNVFNNKNHKKSVRAHLRGKARMQNKRITAEAAAE